MTRSSLLEHLAAHRGQDLSELELERIGTTLAVIPSPRNLITRACGAINVMTSRIIPMSQRNWILTLFVRARH
jgi:hypothetical protein